MKLKRLMAGFASLALIAGTGIAQPIVANAEGTTGYDINEESSVSFYSYLALNATTVPSVKIAYKISYLSGTSSFSPTSTLTSASTNFSEASKELYVDEKSKSTVDPTALNMNTNTTGSVDTVDAISSEYEYYAREATTLNFKNVTYHDVGDYYFLITQDSSESGDLKQIIYATEPKVIRASVRYETDSNNDVVYDTATNKPKFAPISYVLYDSVKTGEGTSATYTAASTKSFGFTSKYVTHSVELEANVDGNQALRDKYYKYHVEISNLIPGRTYLVQPSSTKAEITPSSQNTPDNVTSLTADTKGIISGDFYLKYNSTVTFPYLDYGASYVITDDKETLDSEGYTQPYLVMQGDLLKTGSTTDLTSGDYVKSSGTDVLSLAANKSATFTVYDSASNSIKTYAGTWSLTGTNGTVSLVADGSTKTLNFVMDTIDYRHLSITSTDFNMSNVGYAMLDNSSPVIVGDAVKLDSNYSVTDTSLEKDTIVIVTNYKNGTIPTGIISTVTPYAVALLAGMFGVIIFITKKKHEAEE